MWRFIVCIKKQYQYFFSSIGFQTAIKKKTYLLFYFIFNFSNAMAPKALRSWKLSKFPDPFYPFGIRCIGSGINYAISIWSAHTVDNLIFRNFPEAIKKDEPAKKTYSHPSLEPDCIEDMKVGSRDTVMLMSSGQLKYFESPKRSKTVEYLSDVRAICNCHDGFVLIETPNRGADIFIEFHPEAFPRIDDDDENRRRYDISFEKSPCQSTWLDSHFTVKELVFRKVEPLMRYLLQIDEHRKFKDAEIMYGILFVVDQSLLSFHINPEDESILVDPVITSSANISNFWLSKDETTIFLLLESGAIECIALNEDNGKIESYKIYLEMFTEIVSCDFFDDILTYSDGFKVFHGTFQYNEDAKRFNYQSNREDLSGVAALTILKEWDLVICISENHIFYAIPLRNDNGELAAQTWIEVDHTVQTHLNLYKYDVIELNESYENLVKNLRLQTEMAEAVAFRRSHEASETTFTVKIYASKDIPERSSTPTSIYVSNSEILDHQSYFVKVSMLPTDYKNEFNSHIWNVRLRWQQSANDRKHKCVNIKVFKDALLKPLVIVLHLKQDPATFWLPHLEIDVNAPVQIGQDFLYISFPVKVEQANVEDMIKIHLEKLVFYQISSTEVDVRKSMLDIVQKLDRDGEHNQRDLVYRIKLPSNVTFKDICTSAIFKKNIVDNNVPKKVSTNRMFVTLLGKCLDLTFDEDNDRISLQTDDPGIMLHVKKLIFKVIFNVLYAGGMKKPYKVPNSVLMEYSVSIYFYLV